MKSRTALSHYRLGRTCTLCAWPIVDKNDSNLCHKCYPKVFTPGITIPLRLRQALSSGEAREQRFTPHRRHIPSIEHRYLQSQAILFLEGRGFSDVVQERLFVINNKKYRTDVYGRKEEQTAIVECGTTPISRLLCLASIVNQLFVWPYEYAYPLDISCLKGVLEIGPRYENT